MNARNARMTYENGVLTIVVHALRKNGHRTKKGFGNGDEVAFLDSWIRGKNLRVIFNAFVPDDEVGTDGTYGCSWSLDGSTLRIYGFDKGADYGPTQKGKHIKVAHLKEYAGDVLFEATLYRPKDGVHVQMPWYPGRPSQVDLTANSSGPASALLTRLATQEMQARQAYHFGTGSSESLGKTQDELLQDWMQKKRALDEALRPRGVRRKGGESHQCQATQEPEKWWFAHPQLEEGPDQARTAIEIGRLLSDVLDPTSAVFRKDGDSEWKDAFMIEDALFHVVHDHWALWPNMSWEWLPADGGKLKSFLQRYKLTAREAVVRLWQDAWSGEEVFEPPTGRSPSSGEVLTRLRALEPIAMSEDSQWADTTRLIATIVRFLDADEHGGLSVSTTSPRDWVPTECDDVPLTESYVRPLLERETALAERYLAFWSGLVQSVLGSIPATWESREALSEGVKHEAMDLLAECLIMLSMSPKNMMCDWFSAYEGLLVQHRRTIVASLSEDVEEWYSGFPSDMMTMLATVLEEFEGRTHGPD